MEKRHDERSVAAGEEATIDLLLVQAAGTNLAVVLDQVLEVTSVE